MGPSESKFHCNLKNATCNRVEYFIVPRITYLKVCFNTILTPALTFILTKYYSLYIRIEERCRFWWYGIAVRLWNSFMNLKSLASKKSSHDFSILFTNLTLNFNCWQILCSLKTCERAQGGCFDLHEYYLNE